MKPLVGISLMPEPEFLKACLPLFLKNEIDVIEWSFDIIRNEKAKPRWVKQLLKEYSANNRLIGHGVRYSLFDAKFNKRQITWLKQLKKETKKYNYNHITEHFGFMSSNNFHKGAPLPIPLNKSTLAIGINRLKSIQEVASVRIGIENLALSFCIDDVKKQGKFIEKLTEPINGFLILDLHNIYCQAHNFKIDMLDIIKSYPLKKVREIHISGGSWQNSRYEKDLKKIRRDTHDGKVPNQIFNILSEVLVLCKNVEYIIFEQLGSSLTDEKSQIQFRKDFLKIKTIVNKITYNKPSKLKLIKPKFEKPLTDLVLYKQQQIILKTIRSNKNPHKVLNQLNATELKDWNTQTWKPAMLETAIKLLEKWD
jgi:uncharacterized protein (UPF0276 family)